MTEPHCICLYGHSHHVIFHQGAPQQSCKLDKRLSCPYAEDNECGAYSRVSKTKPVFGVEYCDAGDGETLVSLDEDADFVKIQNMAWSLAFYHGHASR